MSLFSSLKSLGTAVLLLSASGAFIVLFLLGAYSLGDWPLAIYAGFGLLVFHDVINLDNMHRPPFISEHPIIGGLLVFFLWPTFVFSLGMYRRFLLYPLGLAVPFLFLYLIVS